MPDVGMGVTEATVVKWFKAEGDPVEQDEVVAEVETAKTIVEVRSPVTGTLEKILVAEDETVEAQAALATLRTA